MSAFHQLVQGLGRLRATLAQPINTQRPWLQDVLQEVLPGPTMVQCAPGPPPPASPRGGAGAGGGACDDDEDEGAGDDDVIRAFLVQNNPDDGNLNTGLDPDEIKAIQDRELDTVMLRGTEVPVVEWLGTRWKEFTIEAHRPRSLQLPDGLAVVPHPWQLTGVAHQLYLRSTNVKGGILGDAMGLGKTLQGVLLDLMTKDEPGFALVVAPLSCLQQWEDAFDSALKPGFKRRVLKLDTATAHKMNAASLQQYDVIITSYAVLQAEYSRYGDYLRTMENFLNKPLPAANEVPLRPNLLLLTEAWWDKQTKMRLVIFDEAHQLSNVDTLKFKAARDLYAASKHMFTGTIINNRWDDVYGLIALLQGHPIASIAHFHGIFGSNKTSPAGKRYQDKPEGARVDRLQAFLMPLVKARPREELDSILVDVQMHKLTFPLNATETAMVDRYMAKYEDAKQKVAATNSRRRTAPTAGSRPWDQKNRKDDVRVLAYLIRAQQSAIHHLLIDTEFAQAWHDFLQSQPQHVVGRFPSLNQATEKQGDAMFEYLINNTRGCMESSRIYAFCGLYQRCRTDFPKDNIVVFSQQIRVLHLIHRALQVVAVTPVEPLRYDGRLSEIERTAVLAEFNAPGNTRPLLMTVAAGGTGLNILGGNIVIQMEAWWNRNVAKQAWARVQRPGQTKGVLVYEILADSPADETIQKVAEVKALITDEIIRPSIRRDAAPLLTITPRV